MRAEKIGQTSRFKQLQQVDTQLPGRNWVPQAGRGVRWTNGELGRELGRGHGQSSTDTVVQADSIELRRVRWTHMERGATGGVFGFGDNIWVHGGLRRPPRLVGHVEGSRVAVVSPKNL